ncbi:MAG: Sapep family Mn(2+)-dependent dipeptidase [Clostridia bacterium]|nr:Sapep family Mn(2+)-dependent dipeptidase [Clostridia bacterium]
MQKEFYYNLKEEMMQVLTKTLQMDTVRTAPEPNAPFGKNLADCLNYVLEVAKKMGFETYNADNYAGHVDFGNGKQVVSAFGHLDVVPVTDGWTTPPFTPTIRDGKLYARGASDDKGPMIACLFALKALKDSGFKPNKTIRLIFGCDEETSMECIKYYKTKMPLPDLAFSPDGDFPVINIEKGIYAFDLDLGVLPKEIKYLHAGTRVNVVPDTCETVLDKSMIDKLNQLKVNYTLTPNGDAKIITTGVSCHAANAFIGKNATWETFDLLAKIFDDNQTLAFVSQKMAKDVFGVAWGFPLQDQESGKITHSIGVVDLIDGRLKIKLDTRFPVTFNSTYLREQLLKNSISALTIEDNHIKEPMHVKADDELVTTLLGIYNKFTNSNAKPLAIGGGTYSRMLPKCVAFGPAFPGEMTAIHEKDEFIDLQNLDKMALMYAEAFETLAK